MRPLLLTLALAGGALGCRTGAIDDEASARIADVRARTEAEVVYPSCHSDAPLGTNCGLLMRFYGHEEFRTRFRERLCKELSAEACEARYQRMVTARLEQRYYAADFASVARSCDATPGRCDEPVAYELLLLDSHNARVVQEGVRAELQVERERSAAHREDAARWFEGAGEVAFALHKGPKCMSYPSVFSGVTNTVCTEGTR